MARSKIKRGYPGNATEPMLRPDGRWKVRWRYYPNGQPRWQEQTERYHDDAKLLRDWLREQTTMPAKTAEALVDKHYLRSVEQARKIAANERTFGRVAEQYLLVKKGEGIKKTTWDNINYAVTKHAAPWRQLPISTLGADNLNALYQGLLIKVSKATAVGIMGRIVSCLKWANGEGYTGFNPSTARAARRLKYPTPTLTRSKSRDGLTTPQVGALIAAMPTAQDKLIVRLWVSLGPRTTEMFRLACGHFDLDGEVPTVIFVESKGQAADVNHEDGADRHRIGLERRLIPAVRAQIGGRGPDEPFFVRPARTHGRRTTNVWIDPAVWRKEVFNPAVATLVAEGKLPAKAKVTPYWLRHTAASLLAYETKNEAMVGDHLRHMDARTTKLYMHNSDEKRAKVAEALDRTFDGLDDDGLYNLVA